MAFAINTTNPHFPSLYNVEQAVGTNAPNATSDARLVQYFLRGIYGSAAATLAVDGWIGPVTIGWITRFQNDAKASGSNVLVDGRVDRAFGQVSSVSKTSYTILLMNLALQKTNPSAFLALPKSVAMNPSPKPSPYNSKPRKVVNCLVRHWNPTIIYIVYDDGTIEKVVVEGAVIPISN